MDNYIKAVTKAVEDDAVTVCVGDISTDYFDLEHSRSIAEIISAAEATDFAILTFFVDGESQGEMSVLVGYGDESICDHHCNEFFERITADE